MSEHLNVLLEFYRDNDRMVETVERVNDSYLEMLDALEVLEAENAKLQEYVQTLEAANLDVTSRLQDYIGQHDPTDAFVIEAKAENAKLRELCADMLNYFTEPVSKRNNLKERFARLDDIGDRMRELGVEVE